MCSNYPEIELESALGTEDKIEHLSSYAHVVHTTAKQVISRRRKNENVFKMSKNARAKRAKLLFFIVKYANLWGFCCRRRRGCLSSLIFADDVSMKTLNLTNIFLAGVLLYTNRHQRLEQT